MGEIADSYIEMGERQALNHVTGHYKYNKGSKNMTEEKGLAIRTETVPMNYDELSNMSKAFVASGMFSDVKGYSQAIVKIQAGHELGLPPVFSMQNINMIRGRLSSSANTMALLIKRGGKYNYRVVKHDEKICTIKFYENTLKGMEEVGESTFTMDDAKRAGLIKPDSGWEKYPRAMLFSRAISQGARIYCPDAIGGIYTDEEIRSTLPHQDITITEVEPEVEEVEPVEEPSPDVVESTPEPVEEETEVTTQEVKSRIDLDWLKESLTTLKKEFNALEWINEAWGIDKPKITDALLKMTDMQKDRFVKEVQKRLENK